MQARPTVAQLWAPTRGNKDYLMSQIATARCVYAPKCMSWRGIIPDLAAKPTEINEGEVGIIVHVISPVSLSFLGAEVVRLSILTHRWSRPGGAGQGNFSFPASPCARAVC